MDEDSGIGKFGSSLKVANVQALAANVGSNIPKRYLRPEREEDRIAIVNEVSGENIPVIDFGKLFDSEFSEEEAAKLHSACEGWGFFQLINHGVSEDAIQNLKQATKEFFKLPLEAKEKVAQVAGQVEGYGHIFVQSEEQKLDWGDILFITTFPPNLKQLRFWPTTPPTCREAIEEYAIEVKRVADDLLKNISKNLGLGGKMYEMFKGGTQVLRFNYYPACPSPDNVFGMSPHSDGAGLTLLLQVNELQGLQIRRNGGWIPVKALPGAFIVNIGDVIEILCNGKYKSIEHRAVVNNEKERLTVAAFHSLNIGDIVGPIPEILEGEKLLYKRMLFEEYVKQILASKLEGKSKLEQMKLS